jgi:isopenicillin N synthase-like dioxygenase
MQIKIIDFTSPTAGADFTAGLKEIGFAVIENHPISQSLIDKTYALWYDFFKSQDKYNYTFDPITHEGYVSTELSETAKGHSAKDLKEFYHYYLGKKCPDTCRETTFELASQLSAMAGTLLGWVEKNTPADIRQHFSIPLSDMIKDSDRTLFRIIHYPPLTGDEPHDAVRAAPHEDINLLTLLPAATASGLQVKNAQGEWLDVPINPGWIIVNVGDMLQECSSFYYPSTTHRVLNPTGDAARMPRLSMPLFLHPHDDVALSKRHTAESYRKERYEEIGLK